MRLAASVGIVVMGCASSPVERSDLAGLRGAARLHVTADLPALAFSISAKTPLRSGITATIDGVPLELTYDAGRDLPLSGLTFSAVHQSPMVLTIEDPSDTWTMAFLGMASDDLEIGTVAPGQSTAITWRDGPIIDKGNFEIVDSTGRRCGVQNSWLRFADNAAGLDIPLAVALGPATVDIYMRGVFQFGASSARGGGASNCDGPSECAADLGAVRKFDVAVVARTQPLGSSESVNNCGYWP